MALCGTLLVIFLIKIATLANSGYGENILPDKNTCGLYSPESDVSKMSEFPWNVLLKYRNENDAKEFRCAGVLISDKYVLTAAHCVTWFSYNEKTKLLSVRLGEYDLDTDPDCDESSENCKDAPQNIPVESIIVHEEFDMEDDSQRNDIALIKLKSKVRFNDYIKPVCLSPEKNYTERELVMTGWVFCDAQLNSNIPKKSTATVTDPSLCEDVFKIELGENFLCLSHGNKKYSSANDGGSFLYQDPETSNFYAVGINIIYDFCYSLKFPLMYTRVDHYYDWIVNKIKA